jgi:transposase
VIRPSNEVRVYLCRDRVDFRLQLRGLSVLVQEQLALDPFRPHVFAFCNRRRDHVKLLYWERNGFVLWQKKLERDRFAWPRSLASETLLLSGRELNWLLDGIDLLALRPHGELRFDSAL